MTKEPDQALPITAGLVSATAFFAMLWCLADGWMTEPGWQSMGLPGLFMNADMRTVVSLFFEKAEFRNSMRSHKARALPTTLGRTPGIGRPVDGRRVDFVEFLHRNNSPGTRPELGGERDISDGTAVGQPLRCCIVSRAVWYERLRRGTTHDFGLSGEYFETIGHHGGFLKGERNRRIKIKLQQ